MKLELVTLLGSKMNEDVYEVVLPTSTGQIAVFPKHTPLVTLAVPGVISVRRKKSDFDEHMEHFATNGGVVEISGDRVRILVDEADSADEIVEAESQKALERAMQMKQDAKDKVELDKAQALIDRHAVRIKVAELKRRHH
ncbi:MAG TPA: ATP synthase F1 subunit epsilon [Candidatus Saccharimonadales bacterium]|nr:ATP synthase F1 subunit epsilon [Candidatus Saccharimonadales bacterium]